MTNEYKGGWPNAFVIVCAQAHSMLQECLEHMGP